MYIICFSATRAVVNNGQKKYKWEFLLILGSALNSWVTWKGENFKILVLFCIIRTTFRLPDHKHIFFSIWDIYLRRKKISASWPNGKWEAILPRPYYNGEGKFSKKRELLEHEISLCLEFEFQVGHFTSTKKFLVNTPTPWLTLLLVLIKSCVNQKSR